VSIVERVRHELREIGLVTVFFLLWFLTFLTLKKLVLAHYEIGVAVLGTAAISALVVAKVVVILDKTPMARGFRSSFVVFNGASEIDRRLGEGGLRRLFFSRPGESSEG
jgi:hypothetical protein